MYNSTNNYGACIKHTHVHISDLPTIQPSLTHTHTHARSHTHTHAMQAESGENNNLQSRAISINKQRHTSYSITRLWRINTYILTWQVNLYKHCSLCLGKYLLSCVPWADVLKINLNGENVRMVINILCCWTCNHILLSSSGSSFLPKLKELTLAG